MISGFDPDDLFLSISDVSFDDLDQVIFLNPVGEFTSFAVSPENPININIAPCDPETDPSGCVIPNPVPAPALMSIRMQ